MGISASSGEILPGSPPRGTEAVSTCRCTVPDDAVRPVPTLEFTDVDPGEWYVPSFLEQLTGSAVRVTLVEGQKVSYEVITERGKQAAGNLKVA